jgi:hypothetical protein
MKRGTLTRGRPGSPQGIAARSDAVEAESVSGWLKGQWNDIKGNAKWAVVTAVGTGFVILAVALTHGLHLWQQVSLSVCFIFLFGWALAATFRRESRGLKNDRAFAQPIPKPQEPPMSQTDRAMQTRARGDFMTLNWQQKVALREVYRQPGIFVGRLRGQMENTFGFAEPMEKLITPVLKTSLVFQDGLGGINPSPQAIIAKTAERLLSDERF